MKNLDKQRERGVGQEEGKGLPAGFKEVKER